MGVNMVNKCFCCKHGVIKQNMVAGCNMYMPQEYDIGLCEYTYVDRGGDCICPEFVQEKEEEKEKESNKKIGDVVFVLTGREKSSRVPRKICRDFAGTTLFDIAIQKLQRCFNVPNENIYASVGDKSLIDIAKRNNVKIFYRSEESCLEERDVKKIHEYAYYLRGKYKHVIVVNSCMPFLTCNTINKFVDAFLECPAGLFGVIEKKTYYWNEKGECVTRLENGTTMNTKYADVVYEAAHALYGSSIEDILNGYFMGDFSPHNPDIFPIKESIELFDIDYPWQFEVAETLYSNGFSYE